ncbi:MAG: histidine--tRNA ligase [Alphaproteobacteria bacterium]|nr:histidine--tRNA ligase [Alphaproteobacteria bacterium]MCB9692869.1 histidine--tRNA ligase [Alphaproteobacteria bacterium]
MHERQGVLDAIRATFEEHGFEPLDTPAFERIEVLTGKYGDEGDKLIFKILARGEAGERGECDLALRYDLTVPLARVVAMHGELRMPFKRYHMGPVWRADRPARGRFREFWQCDGDILGTTEPTAEAECLAFAWRALDRMGFGDVVLRINDRRLLKALACHLGVEDREGELLIAVDKLDKIGRDGVSAELEGRGFGAGVVSGLWEVLEGDDDPLERMGRVLADQPATAGAVATLREVVRRAELLGVPSTSLSIDPTIARGLDYYTGPIWEGVIPGANMGSVCSGGRYDGLVGMFSGQDVPAVGISLGLDRLMVLREERGLAPKATSAPVLVTIYDSENPDPSIRVARAFREAGIGADLFPDARKLKAQLKYADQRGYPWIAIVGPRESEAGTVQIKEAATRAQHDLPVADAIATVRASLAR